MVIKNCEDKYTYLFWVTKGLKTINAKGAVQKVG